MVCLLGKQGGLYQIQSLTHPHCWQLGAGSAVWCAPLVGQRPEKMEALPFFNDVLARTSRMDFGLFLGLMRCVPSQVFAAVPRYVRSRQVPAGDSEVQRCEAVSFRWVWSL